MPRYEFTEGSSPRFWEIRLDGTSFVTTHGKIGAAGQTSTKAFDSEAKARKEYDKLVADKIKKGYVLIGDPALVAPDEDDIDTVVSAPFLGAKKPAPRT